MITKNPQGSVERETPRLIAWYRNHAKENQGVVPPFANADAVTDLRGGLLKDQARAHGNIQSRVDFACYKCGLPPLGLTADAPFRKAWAPIHDWKFPIAKMQAAAQTHVWTDQAFMLIEQAVTPLPLQAADCWIPELQQQPESIRAWAESFNSIPATPRKVAPDPSRSRIDWNRDELILALDQYLKHSGQDLGERHPEIIELSEFLNKLGAVLGTRGGAKFRNPNGVAMKLMNFRRHDPQFKNDGKTGLSGGSKLEEPVWNEFAGNPRELAEVVSLIRETVANYAGRTDLAGDDEPGIEEASEGKLLTRLHRSRERSRKLVDQAKAKAMKTHGKLACVGCDFEFRQKYGEGAAHIIDCHHTKPVSTLATEGGKTHISDLVLLCANCHRVVHSQRPWLSVDQLKARIKSA